MIEKITEIKKFGSYVDYDWNLEGGFGHTNLIFGWNYSGKTTLSRVFSSYRDGEKYYPDSIISIDETKPEHSNIHVFNKDFVKENLKWDNSEATPFAIIGKELIEQEEKLKNLLNKKRELEEKYEAEKKDLVNLRKTIDDFESSTAKRIKEDYKEVNYNKNKLKDDISSMSDHNNCILSEEDVDSKSKTFRNSEKKQKLDLISTDFIDFKKEYELISQLCAREITAEKIESLANDKKYEEWVRMGLPLQEGFDRCRFCDAIISEDVLKKYHQHFSQEYELLLNELNEEKDKLEKSKKERIIYAKEQFYPELTGNFEKEKEDVNSFIENYNSAIRTLIELVEKRIQNLFKPIECTPFQYDIDTKPIEAFNRMIQSNSSISDNLDEAKESALKSLKNHVIASCLEEFKYFEKKEHAEQCENTLKTLDDEIEGIKTEIKDIEKQRSNKDKAAELINHVLCKYYGKDNLIIEHEDEKFLIIRHGEPAKDLSEGEQTAIAFSYFIANLNETELSQSIVFIDDPISSFDSNHLYLTCSLIVSEFYDNGKLKCNQLFISTHNYEFFMHLRKGIRNEKEQSMKQYLIKRINNGKGAKSVIEDLPNILKGYDSEYIYLFSRIMDFIETPNSDYDQLYDLPNILRKLLDIYLSFKYQAEFKNIGHEIFGDPDYGRVYKLINHESHARIDGLMQPSDLAEYQSVVKLVIDRIKKDDPIHYESVTKKIKNSKNGENKTIQ